MDGPFETAGLDGSNVDLLSETYANLRRQFNAEPTGHIDFQLENFSVFNHYAEFKVRGSYSVRSGNDNCYVLFIETFLKTLSNKRSKTEHFDFQVWALGYLKRDAGHVLIRPETLADKLIEFIYPAELDFNDDKAFSSSFYVVANDRYKAAAALTPGFRQTLLAIRKSEYIMEIVNHTFIIGSGKPVTQGEAIQLAGLVCKLVTNQ